MEIDMKHCHHPVNFYLKPHIDPKDYGFEYKESEYGNYWYLKIGTQSSAIDIEELTRKIHCNGISSGLMAVLLRIAEKGGIDIEDSNDPKTYRMNLSREEYLAVQAMRGHPKQ